MRRNINPLCRRCVSSSVWDKHTRRPGNIVVAAITGGKCDAHALYCFDVFRGNACRGAALQWRLSSVVPGGMRAKKGRCDDNCVFNGAGYTVAPHIYVTPESEQSFTRTGAKAYCAKLFFVLISIVTKVIAQYFSSIYIVYTYIYIYISLHLISWKDAILIQKNNHKQILF